MRMTKPAAAETLPLLGALLCVALLASCKRADESEPTASPLPVVTTPSGVRMVAIPGGWFEMGSRASREKDESPHKVYVSAFYMDQYEVTQQHFEKVMGQNPSRWKDPSNPVEQIRWKQAAEYCNARSRLEGLEPPYDPKTWRCNFESPGYRLPTEAEWEYACRAGTQDEYACGRGPGALGEYAWFKDNSTRGPQPVGRKKPNPWGLYDMYGNVWEWCNDFYAEDYYRRSPEKDPRGPETGQTRVLRGGCWNSRAALLRSAYRNDEDPGYTDACFGRDVSGFVGFRCVRNQPPATM
jgi:formylglycine-generating enzyme required for sulfatase activity